jgi:CRP/FNR family transcriptional regulator, nitrogen oxide reductase regulator
MEQPASGNLRSTRQVIDATRVFARLDVRLRCQLADRAVRRHLARGEALWHAGDKASHFTVILAGLMKIARTGRDGTESIVAVFGPGESIGDIAVVQRGTYPADAVAVGETTEVLKLEAGPVLSAIASDPGVAEALNAVLIEHTHALHEKIAVMSAGAVPQRLATLLLHLKERFSQPVSGRAVRVPIVLSRADLASLIGARIETTIRVMSAWQKRGLVLTGPEGFVLADPEELREIAEGDGSSTSSPE